MSRRVLAIPVLVALLVVAAWYAGFYRTETTHIKTLQAKQQVVAASLLSLDTRYTSLLDSKKNLPAERAALAKLRRAVPNGPELDNLVTTLYGAAAKAGVSMSSIGSPEPSNFGSTAAAGAAAAPGPSVVLLGINVTGTPGQIENLVRVLNSEPRLFVVDDFALTFGTAAVSGPAGGAGNDGQVGTSISLRAFYATPNADTAAS